MPNRSKGGKTDINGNATSIVITNQMIMRQILDITQEIEHHNSIMNNEV